MPDANARSDAPSAPAWVDPDMARILKALALAPPVPEPWTVPLATARANAHRAMCAWNDPLPPAAGVENLNIPGPGGPMRLRLVRPAETRPLPVTVYLHGGGWTFGSLETHDRLVRLLAAESGAAAAALDYRLAPEHPYPAALDDALATVRWLRAHGAEHGLDPRRLVLAGDSAGANLALGACLALRDAGEAPPAGAALFYGCFAPIFDTDSHRRFGTGWNLTSARMEWFWRGYVGGDLAAAAPRAAPLRADLAGLPPLYLTAAALDPLADDTPLLAARLAAAGVRHAVDFYPGVVHGFLQMSRDLPAARRALAEAGRQIRRMVDPT